MSSSAFVTVVTGVSVFVLGQLVVKGAIEPYISFKEQLGKISHLLLSNQAKLSNPCSDLKPEIIHDLKHAAAQLMAKYASLPFYIRKLNIGYRLVPSATEVLSAAHNLNELASKHEEKKGKNTMGCIIQVGRLLNIPTTF
ncbi:hypothetical protein LDJ69_20600 [Escherichia coli]|uniref:hypothetical protein n=1 Tax=Escherichia coli TaxID=562 RepID=UPI001CD96DCA|nr:hypothetical protein [Escherichia coli]MCA2173696.1 hypothetical protein [Escherichia coli]